MTLLNLGWRFPLDPVLPIVLYNGKYRWNAARAIEALIEPPPGRLQDYMPHFNPSLTATNLTD